MKTRLNDFSFDQIHTSTIQMLCLLLVGLLEVLAMCLGNFVYPEFRHTAAEYINLIGIFYFAVTIRKPLSHTARNLLLLGLAFCLWPLAMQLRDFIFVLNPEHPDIRFPQNTYFCEYLMMLSFGAAAQKDGQIRGFRLFGWFYIASSALLTLWAMPIGWGLIPEAIRKPGIWHILRLKLVWNELVLALIYMLGISMCLVYACMYRNLYLRIGLAVLACLEFIPLVLTDSRSVVMMTCCIFGGAAFVCIYRGNGKSAAAGLLAGLVITGACFAFSGEIYSRHVQNFMDASLEQQSETAAAAPEGEETEQIGSAGDLQQYLTPEEYEREREYRTSNKHLVEFGGRVSIWKGALRVLAENPRFLLFGVRDHQRCIPFRKDFAYHAHNSWLETLMQLGIIGLAFACWLTYLAVRHAFSLVFLKKCPRYQKLVCVCMIGLMVSQLVEVYLFIGSYPSNFANMLFLFCLGYLICWDQAAPPIREQQKKLRK